MNTKSKKNSRSMKIRAFATRSRKRRASRSYAPVRLDRIEPLAFDAVQSNIKYRDICFDMSPSLAKIARTALPLADAEEITLCFEQLVDYIEHAKSMKLTNMRRALFMHADAESDILFLLRITDTSSFATIVEGVADSEDSDLSMFFINVMRRHLCYPLFKRNGVESAVGKVSKRKRRKKRRRIQERR